MVIGSIIILFYILSWITGHGTLYNFDNNFVYNLGANFILIIGIILFYKDFKKILKIRKHNKNE